MIFSRKTIFVAGAVLLAACGDKVTVAGPTTPVTPVSVVNSVSVAPTSATLNVGQSITMTAAVNADAGLATTVTWSASAGNVTVSSAGVVLAVSATPGVAVCATSTVDTGKKGCATIVVTAPITQIPATVSIASVTTAGNLNAPVNPAGVAGQVDVTLNVNPGNQNISKVELWVGNGAAAKLACSQSFTAAQAAALRFSADAAVAAQTTFPQVVCSVNTAAFDATSGAPTWLNGAQAIQAKLFTTQSGTATAATASVAQSYTFANVDGFAVTTSGGTQAIDAVGYRWTGNGSLTVNALPVMYSGSSVGTVAAALSANPATGSTCGTAVGNVGTATAKTGNVYVITGTMAGLQSAAGCATIYPNMVTVSATNAAGDNLTLANVTGTPAGVIGTQPGIRWDNVAPTQPALVVNPNGRSGGWQNDAVVWNATNDLATAAQANNWINGTVAITETGVGLPATGAYSVRASTTAALAAAAAPAASAAAMAASASGSTYCGIPYAADRLGNTSAPAATTSCAAAGGTTFGVDRVAPTASFSTVVPANMPANAALTALTQSKVIALDAGLVGNSGFIGGTSVAGISGSISRRTAAATSGTAVTVATTGASNTVVNLTRIDGSAALVADTLVYDFSGITTDAYYTLTTTVVDQAGNVAGTLSRTFLKDNIVPTALAPVQNVVSPTAGGALTFNSTISDDLDLSTGSLTLTFPATSFSNVLTTAGVVAAAPATYAITAFGPTTFNTYNVAPAVTSGTLAAALPALYALQAHADSTTLVASNAYPSGVNAIVSDMANAAVTSGAGTIQNPPANPALYVIGTNYQKFLLARSGSTVNVAGSGTAGAVTSRNITPRVEGSTTQAAPFSSIDVYVLGNGQTAYTFLGTSTLTDQTDNGGQRIWTFSPVAFAPSASFPTTGDATIVGIAKGTGGKYVMGQGTQITVSP